jgi:hypothetical protein
VRQGRAFAWKRESLLSPNSPPTCSKASAAALSRGSEEKDDERRVSAGTNARTTDDGSEAGIMAMWGRGGAEM